MGVDLEKKRKLLLYPIEYQRGCPCEWVLEFARVGDSAGLRDGNGWRCLWAPGWARAHGQRGAKPLSKCVICQHNRQRSNYKD